jgi:TP901 family phage tail tape measure protein
MAESSAHFQAIISVIDRASLPLRAINHQLEQMGEPLKPMAHAMAGLHHQFHEFTELSGLAKMGERLGELRKGFGELGEKIGELLGPVAALGAAGSIAGLFEMSKAAAEFGAGMHAAAEKTGVAIEQLSAFRMAAASNEVAAESMDHGLEKLNRTIAMAAAGKNKDALGLFQKLGISLRDAHGELKNAGEIFPELAEGFNQNENEAVRARMAVALFGKAGQELLPVLIGGKEKLEEMAEKARHFGLMLSDEQGEKAHAMAEGWKDLGLAVKGLSNSIGQHLFPMIEPLVHSLSEWVAANREIIATKVESKVEAVVEALKAINWEAIGNAIGAIAGAFGHLTETAAGAYAVMFGGAAMLAAPFIASLWEVGKIVMLLSGQLGGALVSGIMLAGGAIGDLIIALRAGYGAMAAFNLVCAVNPIGLAIAAVAALALAAWEVYQHWDPIKGFFVDLWAGIVGVFDSAWGKIKPIVDSVAAGASKIVAMLPHSDHPGGAHGIPSVGHNAAPVASLSSRYSAAPQVGEGGGGVLRRPLEQPLPPRESAAPAASRDGEVTVKVELGNAPPGTRVTTETKGAVAPPQVDVGHAFGSGHPVPAF